MTEGPPERRRNPNSVAARLDRSTGFPHEIPTADFARELITLGQDIVGINALVTSLFTWETRFDGDRGKGRPKAPKRTPEEIRRGVLSDLDEAAEHADALVTARGMGDETLVYEILEDAPVGYVGPIRHFYREVTGYTPPPPHSGTIAGAPTPSPRW